MKKVISKKSVSQIVLQNPRKGQAARSSKPTKREPVKRASRRKKPILHPASTLIRMGNLGLAQFRITLSLYYCSISRGSVEGNVTLQFNYETHDAHRGTLRHDAIVPVIIFVSPKPCVWVEELIQAYERHEPPGLDLAVRVGLTAEMVDRVSSYLNSESGRTEEQEQVRIECIGLRPLTPPKSQRGFLTDVSYVQIGREIEQKFTP